MYLSAVTMQFVAMDSPKTTLEQCTKQFLCEATRELVIGLLYRRSTRVTFKTLSRRFVEEYGYQPMSLFGFQTARSTFVDESGHHHGWCGLLTSIPGLHFKRRMINYTKRYTLPGFNDVYWLPELVTVSELLSCRMDRHSRVSRNHANIRNRDKIIFQACELLVGAHDMEPNVDNTNEDGDTALHLVASLNHVGDSHSCTRLVEPLVRAQPDLSLLNDQGETWLHIISGNGACTERHSKLKEDKMYYRLDWNRYRVEFLKIVIQHATSCGAEHWTALSNYPNATGSPPLHMWVLGLLHDSALHKGSFVGNMEEEIKFAKLLIGQGAKVNGCDANGQTPLHLCCDHYAELPELETVASMLLKRGSPIYKFDNLGHTPIMLVEGGSSLWETLEKTHQQNQFKPVSVNHRDILLQTAESDQCSEIGGYQFLSDRYINENSRGSFVFPAVKCEELDGQKYWYEVALKRIQRTVADRRYVKRELEILQNKTKDSQFIVNCQGFRSDANFVYVILELMEGDLTRFVKGYSRRQEDQSVKQAVLCEGARQILKAMEFLHNKDIIHRDLKPENVLYKMNGESYHFKVADFGLAKDMSSSSHSSHSPSGTRKWIAPELICQEDKCYSKVTDVYSLGLVLHYMLSLGHHPFVRAGDRLTEHQIERRMMNDEQGLDISLSSDAQHFLRSTLRKDPTMRPTLEQLKVDIFFWSNRKRMEFLRVVGSLSLSQRNKTSRFAREIAKTPLGRKVKANSWENEIRRFDQRPDKRARLDTNSASDLVHYIRNVYAHVQEYPTAHQEEIDGGIFFEIFPTLLRSVLDAVERAGMMNETAIKNAMMEN